MSGKKAVREVLKLARNLSYVVYRLKNNHFIIKGNNETFCIASTPRSTESIHAVRNKLKRLGPNIVN